MTSNLRYVLRMSGEQYELLVTAISHMRAHPTMLGADAETRDAIETLAGCLAVSEPFENGTREMLNDFTL